MFSYSFELVLNIKKELAKNMLKEIVYIDKNWLMIWGFFKSIRNPFKGYFEGDSFSMILHEIYSSWTRPILFGNFTETEEKTYLTIDMRIHKPSNILFKVIIGLLIIIDIFSVLAMFNNGNLDGLTGIIAFNCLFGVFIYGFYCLFKKERNKSERLIRELFKEYIA